MRSAKAFICALVAMLMSTALWAQTTREQYIQQYKQMAIDAQEQFGIPASIKMAQALLESANGNSRLATMANNHFGIKCKSYWQGETISHDDDAKGECFRKYSSVEDSYNDHSIFLSDGERYRFLFSLPVDDYSAWAHGLKQAGYATNPQYAYLLIDIIEEFKLYDLANAEVEQVEPPLGVVEQAPVVVATPGFNVNDYAVYKKQRGDHTVYINNKTRFVVMFEGETLESLAQNVKIPTKLLRSYNDLQDGQTIEPNQMVYVKFKKNKSRNGASFHVVRAGETLYSISQLYGIRYEKLKDINKKTEDMELPAGMRLRLK
ncbi:MAG: glucosaminidase domain-containing protein [Rikenellaceae bacterium]